MTGGINLSHLDLNRTPSNESISSTWHQSGSRIIWLNGLILSGVRAFRWPLLLIMSGSGVVATRKPTFVPATSLSYTLDSRILGLVFEYP